MIRFNSGGVASGFLGRVAEVSATDLRFAGVNCELLVPFANAGFIYFEPRNIPPDERRFGATLSILWSGREGDLLTVITDFTSLNLTETRPT